jgi:hypothetical protein
MATHYVYDDPNKKELFQGDVLQRTDALTDLLSRFFPYYNDQRDYRYFMVITQSCDLVRREGKTCAAPYVTMSAVRPVEDAVRLEAAKHRETWQSKTRILGSTAQNKVSMFIESLLDNNQAGFFYLHEDQSLGLSPSCCSFLSLPISLRAEHYDCFLDAKIAQLKAEFQAKLGWLLGNMYSRVGTVEWDTVKPAEKLGTEASKILQGTFVIYEQERINEAVADLKRAGTFETLSSEEIEQYVRKKRLVPRSRQFQERAAQTLSGTKLIAPLAGRVAHAMRNDAELKEAIVAKLAKRDAAAAVSAAETATLPHAVSPEVLAEEIIGLIARKLGDVMKDEGFPGREKYIGALITHLLSDEVLKKLIR